MNSKFMFEYSIHDAQLYFCRLPYTVKPAQ